MSRDLNEHHCIGKKTRIFGGRSGHDVVAFCNWNHGSVIDAVLVGGLNIFLWKGLGQVVESEGNQMIEGYLILLDYRLFLFHCF